MNTVYDISLLCVNEMLSLACLVYDCNNELKLIKKDNIFTINDLKIDTLKISPIRKKILRDLFKLHINDKYDAVINKIIDINGVQIIIVTNNTNKRINVVFRGSDELSDWFANLFVVKKNLGDNIKVHSGFYNLLFKDNLYNIISNEIRKIHNIYSDYTLNIVGHSLGGALATLYSYFLSYEIDTNIYVFSFASPRVGNKNWCNIYDNTTNIIHFRYVNRKDIVTAIPYLFYSHCGHYIKINKKNVIDVINKTNYKDINSFVNYYSIKDHSIDNYYTNYNLCYKN